jgi:predicted Zn-dependent peptidase
MEINFMEINLKNIENKIFVIPDNSIPITYLSIVFLIGNYLEKPSNIGINNLCLKTLTRSNKNLSHDALSYYLEKNSISLSASGGNFTSSISLSFPFYSYNKALEILEEILFNYSFRKEDIDESKRDLINSIKLSKDDIWVYLNENSDTAFYNSFLSWDTRGNEKTLKEISRKNLIQWFEKYYLNKSIKKIIVISGYTNEKFEEKIYKKFNKILNYNHLYYDKMKDFEIIKAKKIHNLKLNVRKTFYKHKREKRVSLCYNLYIRSYTFWKKQFKNNDFNIKRKEKPSYRKFKSRGRKYTKKWFYSRRVRSIKKLYLRDIFISFTKKKLQKCHSI